MAAWVIAVVGLFVVGKVAGGATHDSFSVPGVESQKATDLLTASFPTQAGASAQVVFHATEGTLSDPDNAAAMQGALDALASLDHVVVPPPSATLQTSADDTIALATVRYDDDAHNLPGDTYSQLKSAVAPAVDAGLQVEFGGEIPSAADRTPPSSAEGIGLLVAMVILVLAFGSVIAMGLPIGTALFGLAAGAATITFLSAFIDLPSTTEVLATMIGLGVGIDYALFIITRHRAGLHRGLTVEDAVGRSIATAGLSVVIAGGTVVIAILGLAVAGIPFVTFMGVGAALVVAIMVIASLTLLPALIGFAGHNIDRFGIPGTKRVSETRTHDDDGQYHGWARWAHHVSAHPVIYLVAGLTVVIMLAAPLFTMRLGQTDASQNPTSSTLRRSYDLLAEGFGPGFSGPLVLAIDLSGTTNDQAALAAIESAVKADPGVAEASPAVVGPGGDVAVIQVTPMTGPQDEATTQLVNRLRGDVLPPIVASFDTPVHVGGQTAVFIDMSERILSRLPLFIGCVVGLSFVLLLIVFRSILVPIKAAVMNLLSIGAAYGVVVLVLPEGLRGGPHRHPRVVADRQLHPDVHVRDPVRPVHGLRGVPPQPHPRGVQPEPRQHRVGDRGHHDDRSGHHVRGADHGVGLHQLRLRRRPDDQDVRHRPVDRRARRRDDHPARARSRHDEAARQRQLVVPEVARPDPAERRHRGRGRDSRLRSSKRELVPADDPVLELV